MSLVANFRGHIGEVTDIRTKRAPDLGQFKRFARPSVGFTMRYGLLLCGMVIRSHFSILFNPSIILTAASFLIDSYHPSYSSPFFGEE